ncbi:ABC transporter permease [Lachnobacterium bovis]|uniref:ABC transporter permease n=1 Tax=Lachnobacterium bovis TaxID=140626 RepID=UPI00048FF781|nr:ABC transporter permease [Lachnobacterium bovis]
MFAQICLIKSNIKKQKADVIVFLTLVLISTMLMSVSIAMLFNMSKVVESHFEEINGADITISINKNAKAITQKIIEKDNRIKAYDVSRRLLINAKHKAKSSSTWRDFTFTVQSYNEKRNINKTYKYPNKYKDNEILIPYYLHSDYKVGSILQLKFYGVKYDLKVVGYVQDPMYATPLNVTLYTIYASDKMMDEFSKIKDVISQVKFNATLYPQYYNDKVEDDIVDKVTKETGGVVDSQKLVTEAIGWYSGMKGGCMFMPNMALGILLVFSIMIFVISTLVISFAIRNFIEKNMRDFGLLMASGYKISTLRGVVVYEIGLVTLFGTIIGSTIGKVVYKRAGKLVENVLGLEWNQGLNFINMFIVSLFIILFSCAVAYISSGKFKKITVLTALRGGINTHNYKKNFFPLTATRLPINLALSLKSIFSSWKKSLAIFLMMAITAIIMQTAYGIYYNFGNNQEKIFEFSGTESGTIGVYGNEALGEKLKKMKYVKAMNAKYENATCYYKNGEKGRVITTSVYKDLSELRYCNLIEGRLSKYPNEIIVAGGLADDLNIKSGDAIEVGLTKAGKKKIFIVTGIYQQINNMGRTVMMNKNAFERLNPVEKKWKEEVFYDIYAEDGKNFQNMKKEVLKIYPEGKNKIDNYEKLASETMDVVRNVLSKISIAISIITAFIVMFVEGLLIHSKVVMEWKNLGLNKALGFSSKKLMAQMVMSNIPIILVGAFIGAIVSKPIACNLLIIGMSSFGMKTVKMEFGIEGVILTISIITICAIISATITSFRIRKANPIDMLVKYGEN